MNRWYVVQTQIKREALAVSHLRNQGFEVYLPRLRKSRRHARRIERVLARMFPRYVFVRMDTNACRWRAINGTIGVSCLISFDATPAPMPEGVVEDIMGREGEDGAILPPVRNFQKGERLRLMEGPFGEQIGLFENMADEERVILLLYLLGREVRVKAPLAYLAIA